MYMYITRTLCLKNRHCFGLHVHQPTVQIFGLNITEGAGNQIISYFPTSPPGETQKHENRIFSLKCCITAFPEFNQSLFDFFSFVDFAAVDYLNLVINCVQLWPVGAIAQR